MQLGMRWNSGASSSSSASRHDGWVGTVFGSGIWDVLVLGWDGMYYELRIRYHIRRLKGGR